MDLDRKYQYSAEERNTICIILSTVVVDFLCIERINYMNLKKIFLRIFYGLFYQFHLPLFKINFALLFKKCAAVFALLLCLKKCNGQMTSIASFQVQNSFCAISGSQDICKTIQIFYSCGFFETPCRLVGIQLNTA